MVCVGWQYTYLQMLPALVIASSAPPKLGTRDSSGRVAGRFYGEAGIVATDLASMFSLGLRRRTSMLWSNCSQ